MMSWTFFWKAWKIFVGFYAKVGCLTDLILRSSMVLWKLDVSTALLKSLNIANTIVARNLYPFSGCPVIHSLI